MREFKVHGEGQGPRFRNQGKKWYDGDTITEKDLMGIYRADHIDVLIESGALVPVLSSPVEPPTVASPAAKPRAIKPKR